MLKKVNSHIQFSPLISSVIALSAKMRGTSGQICECPLYFQNKNFTCTAVWYNDVFILQVQRCVYFAAETDKTYKSWKTKK